jgi:hypothetical protein
MIQAIHDSLMLILVTVLAVGFFMVLVGLFMDYK